MQYLFRQRLLCNSSYVVPWTWCCPRSPKIACQQEPEFTLEEHDRSGGTRQPATGPISDNRRPGQADVSETGRGAVPGRDRQEIARIV